MFPLEHSFSDRAAAVAPMAAEFAPVSLERKETSTWKKNLRPNRA